MSKTMSVIQNIECTLNNEQLRPDERAEFECLHNALIRVVDDAEFETGESCVNFFFPAAYISSKVYNFIYAQGLHLDGGIGNDACVWFSSDDDCCDDEYNYDNEYDDDDEYDDDNTYYGDTEYYLSCNCIALDDDDDEYYGMRVVVDVRLVPATPDNVDRAIEEAYGPVL